MEHSAHVICKEDIAICVVLTILYAQPRLNMNSLAPPRIWSLNLDQSDSTSTPTYLRLLLLEAIAPLQMNQY
jgi:hypothetical protein